MPRNSSVTDQLIRQRIEYAVKLKIAGGATNNILEKINAESQVKGWGEISLRQLKRDFATYYKNTRVVSSEEEDYLQGIKEMHIQEMEMHMENLSFRIRDKKDWKPYEFEKELKLLMDLKGKYLALTKTDTQLTSKYSTDNFLRRQEETGDYIASLPPQIRSEYFTNPITALVKAIDEVDPPQNIDVCASINEVVDDDYETPVDPRLKAVLVNYYSELFRVKEELIEEKRNKNAF